MSGQHDFLYVSNRKLAALAVGDARARYGLSNIKGEVRGPLVSLSVEASGRDGQGQDARSADAPHMPISKAIKEIRKRSIPYNDEGALAGNWVLFSVPMNWCELAGRYFNSTVILVDHAGLLPDPSVRLMLHGSAEHLTSKVAKIDITGDVRRLVSTSSAGAFVYELARNVAEVVRVINSSKDPVIGGPPDAASEMLASGIARIVGALDRRFVAGTAAQVAGLARVTAVVPVSGQLGDVRRVLLASPLYVEYDNSRKK